MSTGKPTTISQDGLMKLVTSSFQNATFISVGHRPELEAFHSRKIVLERRLGAAHFVSDIHLTSPTRHGRLLRQWLRRRKRRKTSASAKKAAGS